MCNELPLDMDIDCPQNPKHHMLTEEFLRSAWPSNYNPPTTLTSMSVEETAIWLRVLSKLKGWSEGETYSVAFETNGVCGHMLSSLNVEILRDKFGVRKLGHRLEIVEAIGKNELSLVNPSITSLCPKL